MIHPPDTHNLDNDPYRLLKLSHSLRYQLSQPLGRKPPSENAKGLVQVQVPGSASIEAHAERAQQPVPPASHVRSSLQQPLPVVQGPGTRSGPYDGFASKDWLQREVRQDVDTLRSHVDEYASKREQRAFDMERTALQAEITDLRKRLAESEARAAKLELMLPNDNGDFRRLRAELEELEQEADHFCSLYERHAAATKAALSGYRQAIEDIDDIGQELGRMQQIIDTIPERREPTGAAMHTGNGVPAAGAAAAPQQLYAAAPPHANSPAAVPPRACCGCFRFGRW